MTLETKKFRLVLAGVLIFIFGIGIGIGIGVGFWMGRAECVVPDGRQAQNESIVSPSEDGKDFVGEFKVARVIDGDTIEIEGGERVRYIGIDTPETVDPQKPVECFGAEASDKNKELVAGKTVRLEKDTTNRDKYNRLLRYVYVGDDFINLELVAQGFAHAHAYPPDIKYQNQFSAAQQAAEKFKSGLWAACPF